MRTRIALATALVVAIATVSTVIIVAGGAPATTRSSAVSCGPTGPLPGTTVQVRAWDMGAMMGTGSGVSDGAGMGPGYGMGPGTGMGSGYGAGRGTGMGSGYGAGRGYGPGGGGSVPYSGTMGLALSRATVPAGQVSFVVTNGGGLVHELVVLPLHAGTVGERTAGPDGTVSEAGSLGEASASCRAGHGEGIDPGSTGWVTLQLAPGRYELVCNEPGHYAAGMEALLTVT